MTDDTLGRRLNDRTEESCGVCGGDRRIANSFGLTTTCPSCHGTGRRLETSGFRDVTKTKASHYRTAVGATNGSAVVAKAQWPTTHEGGRLATEVQASSCSAPDKAKIIREIIDYEISHGQCTQTFLKKVRKQVRPRSG